MNANRHLTIGVNILAGTNYSTLHNKYLALRPRSAMFFEQTDK